MAFPRKNHSQLEVAALLAILIIAAVLRMGAPDIFEFKRDEANLSQLALDFARGHTLPLLGISSSAGIPNPPINVYIFAIPYAISADPMMANQFVAALNVLAVALVYLVMRRYYGAGPALMAALLYAVSPWGVIYSRKIWAQNILPPFALMTLLCTLAGWVDGRRWGQWLSLPLLSLTAQIHYSGITLAPAVLYLIWAFRPRTTRAFAGSLIITLATVVPFAIGLVQAELLSVEKLQMLRSASETPSDGVHLTGQTLHFAALTIAGTEIHALTGPHAFADFMATVPDVALLFGLITWGVVAGAGWMCLRYLKIRNTRRHIDAALLLGIITPIALFSLTWTTPYTHYLLIMLPLAYMVFGAAAGDLWTALRPKAGLHRAVFGIGGAGMAAILLLQILASVRLLDFVAATPTPEAFGTPYVYLRPIRDYILASGTPEVIGALDGQVIGIDGDTSVWNFLLADVPSRRFVDAETDIYPANEAQRLTRACDNPAAQHFPLRAADEGCYQVAAHTGMPAFANVTPLGIHLANQVQLVAYAWSPDDSCLTIIWSPGIQEERDYSFLVHFTDAAGDEILNVDGLSLLSRYWRAGDTVTRIFCTPDSADAARIRGVNLGMYAYEYGVFHNVDVLDAAGAPAGHSVHVSFNNQASVP